MTSMTRVDVACATPYRPLMTFDTVATDTPASRATSVMVTRCPMRGIVAAREASAAPVGGAHHLHRRVHREPQRDVERESGAGPAPPREERRALPGADVVEAVRSVLGHAPTLPRRAGPGHRPRGGGARTPSGGPRPRFRRGRRARSRPWSAPRTVPGNGLAGRGGAGRCGSDDGGRP